ERPEIMDEERFLDPARWPEHQLEIMGMLAEWCQDLPREEVWRRGQELRIPGAPAFDARDLMGAQNLKEREFFLEVDHPKAGVIVMPGFPYKFSETPPAIRRPAPTLGQDGDGWPPDRRGRPALARVTLDRAPMVPDSDADKRLPLRGIRVLEITNNWAGPVTGRNLGDLGAEVIKIESPTRLAARNGHFTGLQPFRYHYNRVSYDNKMNRSKYGVTIDLTQPQGRDLFLRLVKEADVVIENNSPRVMRNVNLGYETLRQVNPRIIMVQISAYGQTGPLRDFIAYGANVEAACGLAAVTGYPDDERPYRTGYYYADPITATHASLAILAALLHRERTGQGQHIDLSLQENGMAFLPDALLEYTMTGHLARRMGNRHARYAPQGCYPSMGNDAWMVLSVRSDEEWRRFVDVVGDPRWRDQRFATQEGRRAHHDELDGLIAEWSRRYDHNEASAMLQQRGIPAAPVLANWEMVSNPHAHDRGFYVMVPHPEMGVFPFPGIVWKFSETPGAIRMPCPLFGQHNDLVFGEFLGLSDAQIEGLRKSRVVAGEPPPEFLLPPVLPGLARPVPAASQKAKGD
ncbi:MAG: CoA transferase, partial [Dehalococcoidia bacterium]